MIEGLHFDIPADELESHLNDRHGHHTGRVETYAKQIKDFEDNKIEGMAYTNGDPIKAMKDKKAEHDSLVAKYAFLRDHVITGETYRLSEDDLRKIEMLPLARYY